MEYIYNLSRLELTQVTHILPMIVGCISNRKTPDLQLSGFMLFSILADKFTFSDTAMNEVVLTAAKNCAETCMPELLQFLADLTIHGHLKSIPAEVLKIVCGASNVVAAFRKTSSSHDVKPLIAQFRAHLEAQNEHLDLENLIIRLS
jgi:hypothetical protein